MDLQKKKRYVNISVVLIIISFLVLFFTDHITKAMALLFISGGILGLITRNIPNYRVSNNPFIKNDTSYNKGSIMGPLLNIFLIIGGLFWLSM